ncbi:MAG: hypothetical protein GX558_02390 [Clostridiales bacterium]|nr:hypothetical protein [Clostridiales bacterium]
MKALSRLAALLLCLALAGAASAEGGGDGEWVTFLLLCNEGMLNDGGDVGNTLMVVSMNAAEGSIRQLMFTWDSFINYPGFEMPQLLDKPFRVGGPEETLKLFNQNFGQSIDSYLSINFMNLASLIDSFGGVTLDVTRAERNALNGMVASKKQSALIALKSFMLDETLYNALFDSFYLNEYGPNTQVSGLQAVGYGWLQYDSVANCCLREVEVIADLFRQVGGFVEQRVAFYVDGETPPDGGDGRRPVNLSQLSGEDREFLYRLVSPIFEKSYNNLTREKIETVSVAIARAAYDARRMDKNIFEMIEYQILPLEHDQPYTTIAGVQGHALDYAANTLAINRFLRNAGESPRPEEMP